MEIVDRRLDEGELGAKIAAGRDSTIYAIGNDRVLRRASDERSLVAESEAMEAIRALGYPVPQVHRVGPGEMVLERVAGPTMLDDLGLHPWRIGAHARLLADLHHRLHELEPPSDLKPFVVPGGSILHMDLHPANVILSPDGPVVIDWTNVVNGPSGADVAMSWIIMATSEIDDSPMIKAGALLLRRRLVRLFVDAAGREEAAAQLAAVGEQRASDRNVRPAEVDSVHKLVARHAA